MNDTGKIDNHTSGGTKDRAQVTHELAKVEAAETVENTEKDLKHSGQLLSKNRQVSGGFGQCRKHGVQSAEEVLQERNDGVENRILVLEKYEQKESANDEHAARKDESDDGKDQSDVGSASQLFLIIQGLGQTLRLKGVGHSHESFADHRFLGGNGASPIVHFSPSLSLKFLSRNNFIHCQRNWVFPLEETGTISNR